MANVDPIYSRLPDVSSNGSTGMVNVLTTASNDYTGVGANYKLVFTADATNGGYIQRLRFKAMGTNTATVARIMFNNGSSPGTATNNSFYGEVSLPATTASASTATIDLDYPINCGINPGFCIYVGLGTTVVGGWAVTPIGGKY